MKIIKPMLIFISLWTTVCFAQLLPPPSDKTSTHNRHFWLNVALGVGGTKSIVGKRFRNYGGVAGELSLNYRLNYHWLLTARSIHLISYPYFNGRTTDCALFNTSSCDEKQSWTSDKGVLMGYILQGDYGYGTLSLGLAHTEGITSAGSTKDEFNTIGFPLESQVFWTPSGFFGLGLIAFANINKYRWFGGTLLALQLGDFQRTTGD